MSSEAVGAESPVVSTRAPCSAPSLELPRGVSKTGGRARSQRSTPQHLNTSTPHPSTAFGELASYWAMLYHLDWESLNPENVKDSPRWLISASQPPHRFLFLVPREQLLLSEIRALLRLQRAREMAPRPALLLDSPLALRQAPPGSPNQPQGSQLSNPRSPAPRTPKPRDPPTPQPQPNHRVLPPHGN